MHRHPSLSIKIRSIITWTILCILVPIYNLIGYLIFFLSPKIKHRVLTSWGRVFTFLSKHICLVDYQVIGLENLLPNSQVIFASNHQSMWETMAFNVFLPQHVWILKRELTYIPFFGWSLRILSPIAINRADKLAAATQILTQSKKRIKDGFNIMIFPEGTRVAVDKVEQYKTGVARMAIFLNKPIIPIAHNAGYVMPKGGPWIYPGLVTIRIAKAIYPNSNDDPDVLTLKIQDIIHKERHLIPPPQIKSN